MKILVKGNSKRTEELKQKISLLDYELVCIDENTNYLVNDNDFDMIFELNFDDDIQNNFKNYQNLKKTPVFVCAVKNSLAQIVHQHHENIAFPLFGINSIDTFINRNLLEVSVYNKMDEMTLKNCMQQLNWDYKLVQDRVGMVTPRVICMIINEACYTLQEGTASLVDIDTSMKLGTNYPLGPFEWADKIGIQHVYQILDSVYNDTKDERYKICSLLKTHYLKNLKFYN